MYVGNLNYRVKEGDLEQAMAAYGVVGTPIGNQGSKT